jgi:hypothetical protein
MVELLHPGLTRDQIEKFAGLSNDINPIHQKYKPKSTNNSKELNEEQIVPGVFPACLLFSCVPFSRGSYDLSFNVPIFPDMSLKVTDVGVIVNSKTPAIDVKRYSENKTTYDIENKSSLPYNRDETIEGLFNPDCFKPYFTNLSQDDSFRLGIVSGICSSTYQTANLVYSREIDLNSDIEVPVYTWMSLYLNSIPDSGSVNFILDKKNSGISHELNEKTGKLEKILTSRVQVISMVKIKEKSRSDSVAVNLIGAFAQKATVISKDSFNRKMFVAKRMLTR